jgi:hypothetical protein
MFNLTWVKIKEPRTEALLHGGSQLIPHYESQEFYGNSNDVIFRYFSEKVDWYEGFFGFVMDAETVPGCLDVRNSHHPFF